MAESHLQVNYDGTISDERTNLLPNNKELKTKFLTQLFTRNNWNVVSIDNPTSCLWNIIVQNPQGSEFKIKLLLSSIRDEARQPDEFKTQFGGKVDFSSIEEGWVNIPLGVYLKEEDTPVDNWLLAAYAIEGINFLGNPSFRGVRTKGLQLAQSLGFLENGSCIIFRPEFIYHVVYLFAYRQSNVYNNKFNDKEAERADEIVSYPRPLQQIYFGAPGTGKSHRIKQVCREFEHYRITFHPDTDYASFVGSYKPITHSEQVYTNMGDKAIPLKDSVTGEPVTTTKITYQYVYQAFLNAYIAAWKEQQKENPQPVFLVIEEINRGNCAQIFGDIFQLLDRNESGFSEYPIIADNDLRKELAKEFETLNVLNGENINGIYDDDIIGKVKSGSHLLLPNNLYIWATMNTSDQSLFPIDSAFKRRWEWKYVKIADSGKGYRIAVNGNEYDWWEFVNAINFQIGTDTDQEDKKLGYFFAKAKKNDEGKYIISADTFLSKVIFFIYNDVYKDFGFDADIFKDEDGQVLTFSNYFDQYGDTVPEKVERFIQNLGLQPLTVGEAVDMDGDNPVPSALKARVNGTKVWTITYAFYQILRAIARNYTFEELQSLVGEYVKRDEPIMKTIASPATYEKEKRWYNYKPLSTKDGLTFVISNQWKKEYIPQLMALAKAENVSYEELPE